jgi:hypothetical protein
VAERSGISSKGSNEGEVIIVVLTKGGITRMLLHHNLEGFVSGTTRASKDLTESAPLRDAHFGTGISRS